MAPLTDCMRVGLRPYHVLHRAFRGQSQREHRFLEGRRLLQGLNHLCQVHAPGKIEMIHD